MDWDELVTATLDAAGQAVDLVGRAEVADAWSQPSVLPEMTVGALAAHVAQMVAAPVAWLEAGPDAAAGRTEASLHEVYGRARVQPDEGLEGPVPTAIRGWADDGAAKGPEATATEVRASLTRLRELLPSAAPTTLIPSVFTEGWAMSLPVYLSTRCIEFLVHADDLAASVGIDPPPPSPAAATAAIEAMVGLCRERAGDAAVIRALARPERADLETLRAL